MILRSLVTFSLAVHINHSTFSPAGKKRPKKHLKDLLKALGVDTLK